MHYSLSVVNHGFLASYGPFLLTVNVVESMDQASAKQS